MKKTYFLFGLALFFAVATYPADAIFAAGEPTGIAANGNLSFAPSSVKDKESFTIKLSGAENIPAGTVARLWIDAGNTGNFRDFGTWLTIGELKKGVQRTMNCSAYSSYDPAGPRDVSGKILNQRLYIAYEGLNSRSEVVSHTKDCSSAPKDGGSTPPVPMAPTGPATCSVTPGSATIDQNGTLSFKTSSSQSSIGGNYVYVVAREFSSGIYSDIGVGKVIPIGGNSVDFKIYALSNAKTGNNTFKVYCSTGCPMSGCPSGGAPEVIGSATVNLTVTGTNTGGGGSGGGGGGGSVSCSIPNVSMPTNSSLYLSVEADVGVGGNIALTGSSGQDISVSPVHSNIKFEGGMQHGREPVAAIVRTGPTFTGGSYSLTCDLPAGKSTATGSASLPALSNPSGKMKLSQVEYLGDTMFPISECDYTVKGCRVQFYDGGSGPRIISYMGSPALVGGDFKASHPAPAKGSVTTARLFSLADPMNPARVESATGPSIDPQYDAFGDFGAALSANAVAYSSDGKYRAIVTSQGWLFVSPDGRTKVRAGQVTGDGKDISIVKSGSSYVLLHLRGALNITNARVDDSEQYIEDPLPSSFPDFSQNDNNGAKIVVNNGLNIILLPTDSFSRIYEGFVPKVKLFSSEQREAIAELQIPPESLRDGSYSAAEYGTIPISGGDYVYVVRNLSGAINSKRAVDVFKVEYATKKITQVVKAALLPEGTVSAAAGFDIGSGNVGIIVFTRFDKGVTANPYGNYETRIKAFLISDLAAGGVTDILTNSPVSLSADTGSVVTGYGTLGRGGTVGSLEVKADSFSRNGVTYVYTATSFGLGVKVWKFEAASASGGGSTGGTPPIIPPVIPPSAGGGCDFTLTAVPESLTVKTNSSFAIYGLKASDNSDKTCFVSVTAQAIKDANGNRIISPSSAAATLIVPGMQNIFYFNLSNPPAGSYEIPIKAFARGVTAKTMNLKLIVQ